MKIAVMGAGSVGGYFGGTLARAGNQVTLIARGPHLQHVLQHGLRMDTGQPLTIPEPKRVIVKG